jgi:hypothetical protein
MRLKQESQYERLLVNVFIYLCFIGAINLSHYVQWIGKDVEGSGWGLHWGGFSNHFYIATENVQEHQSFPVEIQYFLLAL